MPNYADDLLISAKLLRSRQIASNRREIIDFGAQLERRAINALNTEAQAARFDLGPIKGRWEFIVTAPGFKRPLLRQQHVARWLEAVKSDQTSILVPAAWQAPR